MFSGKKEIASVSLKDKPELEIYPFLYDVTVTYKDGTSTKKEMFGGSIWKQYAQYLSADDQKWCTKELYDKDHFCLPEEDQDPSRKGEIDPMILTLEELGWDQPAAPEHKPMKPGM